MPVARRSQYVVVDRDGVSNVVDVAGGSLPVAISELVASLARDRRKEQAAREQQRIVALRLRRAGASWAVIGTALGVTREAAFKRFSGETRQELAGAASGELPVVVDELAAGLARERRKEQAAKNRQRLIVQQLHQAGASWAVIGTALGVTREAAFKRFSGDRLL